MRLRGTKERKALRMRNEEFLSFYSAKPQSQVWFYYVVWWSMNVILVPFFFSCLALEDLITFLFSLIFLGQHGTESRYGFASRVPRTDCEGVLCAADQSAGCTAALTYAREISLPVQPQRLHESFSGNSVRPFVWKVIFRREIAGWNVVLTKI